MVKVSATDQPYSDAALRHSEAKAAEAWERGLGAADQLRIALDAAHDREALGLGASVHAASYRREVIEEAAECLRAASATFSDDVWFGEAADFLLREFEATEAKP